MASASNRSCSTTVVPYTALRTRIDSPPTCTRGSGHSHRSATSNPSATAEPSAFASQLPKLRATGRGAEVVPEVCISVATESSDSGERTNRPARPASGSSHHHGRPLRARRSLVRAQPHVDRHRHGATQENSRAASRRTRVLRAARSRRGRRARRRARSAHPPPRAPAPAGARSRSPRRHRGPGGAKLPAQASDSRPKR